MTPELVQKIQEENQLLKVTTEQNDAMAAKIAELQAILKTKQMTEQENADLTARVLSWKRPRRNWRTNWSKPSLCPTAPRRRNRKKVGTSACQAFCILVISELTRQKAMINAISLELNAASEVTFRKNRDVEYATLLGIQNVYLSEKSTAKLPISVLLQSNCVEYARTVALAKGRRFIVHGKLTYSEQHKSFTLKADQLTVFPLSKSQAADGDDAVAALAEQSAPDLESSKKNQNED